MISTECTIACVPSEDGFVVTHGTDAMPYTAAALSTMACIWIVILREYN